MPTKLSRATEGTSFDLAFESDHGIQVRHWHKDNMVFSVEISHPKCGICVTKAVSPEGGVERATPLGSSPFLYVSAYEHSFFSIGRKFISRDVRYCRFHL
jgi:hypothetical protein